eukprot:7088836-Pyramimonas_sp.AAC.1
MDAQALRYLGHGERVGTQQEQALHVVPVGDDGLAVLVRANQHGAVLSHAHLEERLHGLQVRQ